MFGQRADGGAGGGAAAGVAGHLPQQIEQTGHNEAVAAHILRFLLTPDQLGVVGVAADDSLQQVGVHGIELLHPDQCAVLDLFVPAVGEQVVVHLA